VAIEIAEKFQVSAPIDAVWRFVMDPQQVVTCMPGAELEEVVDERTFLGSVKVKLGAITTSYKGRIQLTEIDDQAYSIRMVAEGRETGGGTAKGSVSSRLRPLSDGQTEIVTEASVDLTGRVVQVGRGMIQGIAHQLFQQFVNSTKARLEVPEAASGEALPVESKPIRIVPLVLATLWAAITRFFRRLFPKR
jgi:carbon monoxide dehydrogenase subunit G